MYVCIKTVFLYRTYATYMYTYLLLPYSDSYMVGEYKYSKYTCYLWNPCMCIEVFEYSFVFVDVVKFPTSFPLQYVSHHVCSVSLLNTTCFFFWLLLASIADGGPRWPALPPRRPLGGTSARPLTELSAVCESSAFFHNFTTCVITYNGTSDF